MQKQQQFQARQGDVFIERVEQLPEDVTEVKRDAGRIVLAYGEVTGHAHAIAERNATLFSKIGTDERWLVIRPGSIDSDALCVGCGEVLDDVERPADGGLACNRCGHTYQSPEQAVFGVAGVVLRHEEHAAITLDPGIYRVGKQREYSPEAIRYVAD